MTFSFKAVLIYTLVVLIASAGIIGYVVYSNQDNQKVLIQRLAETKTENERIASDNSVLSSKYATEVSSGKALWDSLYKRDTFIKRLFAKQGELEKRLKSKDEEISQYVIITSQQQYQINNLITTLQSPGIYKTSLQNNWIRYNQTFDYELRKFGPLDLTVRDSLVVLSAHSESGYTKIYVQSVNPYSVKDSTVIEFKENKELKPGESAGFFSKWDLVKFPVMIGVGYAIGSLKR